MNDTPRDPRKFYKATDSRGLWVRNGRYYALMRSGGKRHRFPLYGADRNPPTSVQRATELLFELRKKRDEGEAPSTSVPHLGDYAEHYYTY
jgi:hypothetical protein